LDPPRTELHWHWPDWLAPAVLHMILIGAAAMALLQGIRLIRFRRLLARARPAPEALTFEVDQLASRLRVRPPSVRMGPGIGSPLVYGLLRPVLLWPEILTDKLSPQRQKAVIIHELAHLRRRDHWVAWLRALAGCLWWWNPVYWYVSRQLGRTAELACDAWVVAALPEARRDYAEALLAVAGHWSRTAALAPAVGMSGSRRDFERRLIMVMRDSVPCRAPVLGLVAIGVLALGVLPGLSVSQEAPKPAKIVAPGQPTQPAPAQPADVIPYIADFVNTVPVEVFYTAQVAQAPADERDRKLKELEDKLQVLLKEVKSLRETKITTQPAPNTSATEKPARRNFVIDGQTANWAQSVPITTGHWVYGATVDQQGTVTLSRATYKLPKEKADALAAFLKHVKASVLETKVEDDGIIVTTTPDVQHTIGQLVALMTGQPHIGKFSGYKLAPGETTSAPREATPAKRP
jgi:beta-lactamase regulating signal transducer with metallopeptidase domain